MNTCEWYYYQSRDTNHDVDMYVCYIKNGTRGNGGYHMYSNIDDSNAFAFNFVTELLWLNAEDCYVYDCYDDEGCTGFTLSDDSDNTYGMERLHLSMIDVKIGCHSFITNTATMQVMWRQVTIYILKVTVA